MTNCFNIEIISVVTSICAKVLLSIELNNNGDAGLYQFT